MSKNVNTLLSKRLKKNDKSSKKMSQMATQSARGDLTSFSGVFSIVDLNEGEKGLLEAILHEFSTGKQNISNDLSSLVSLTSEVKAINNQAAILHGERIKKAQTLLKKYKDGAFTTWLIAAYGNRQTPYNFLQYYEFYTAMPQRLRSLIELMPRQAIYTLASREGSIDKKEKIVKNYNGETKSEILALIREEFPLHEEDKRKHNIGESLMKVIHRLTSQVKKVRVTLTKAQKKTIFKQLDDLYELIEKCKAR